MLTRYRIAIAVLFLALGACGGGGYSPELETVTFGIKQWGVAGKRTFGTSVAVDAGGNVYVTSGTITSYLGITPADLVEADLIKYDANGAKLYARRLHDRATANATAIDANGNVYVAGSIQLDEYVPHGARLDAFLTKVDSDGTEFYTRQLGMPEGTTKGDSTAIDPNGNVYLAGVTNVGLDGNANTNSYEAYLTKFGSNGTKLYTRQVSLSTLPLCRYSIALDANGNVYLAGTGTTITDSSRSPFLAKYDANGTQLYVRLLGIPNEEATVCSTVVDANGNVYLAGSTRKQYFSDAFLAKYDANGTQLYMARLSAGGETYTYGRSIAIDASGGVYLAGSTSGDALLAKYDGNGNKVYVRLLGVAGASTSAESIALDANGNVYLAGTTTGGLDGNALTGLDDGFVAKFDASGNRR